MDLIKDLEKSIKKVFEDEIEIHFNELKIDYFKHKNSSKNEPSLTLFIDNEPLTGKRKYKVEYECSCGRLNKIYLSKFLKKERLRCQHCIEDEEKIMWHKLYFEKKRNGEERGSKNVLNKTIYDFENESDNFKNEYFKKHLTFEEFEEFKPYIYSVKNIIIENTNFKLLIAEKCTNHNKYCQKILLENGETLSLQDICLRCKTCGKVFHIRRLPKEKINNNNFSCKYCSLANCSFEVKKYNDEGLLYQSGLELFFIKECEKRNIKIKNGIEIPYYFKGINRTYLTDFYLPDYKLIIELKDNHIWHKKQVESGKWQYKENAALEYCKNNNTIFKLLFPKDLNTFFEDIERDSLNFSEN